jgi:tRNA threonylcarbamoyladenosine biosynthesis protein TsaB
LLDSAELQLSDLQGIAFGAGPGSFTGVRIAAGVAQGLGFGANLPVVSVCTLLALAEASGADKVIACLDARMGEVYHAAYEKIDDTWRCIIEPGLYKPDAVPAIEGANWVGAGSGWQTYAEQLSAVYVEQLQSTQPQLLPSSAAILKLALPIFAKGEAKPASEAMPIYIRNRVALKTAEREQGLRL